MVAETEAIFGVGVYSVSEATRFARARRTLADRWVFGYSPSPCRSYSRLIDPDLPRAGHERSMSFLALTELRLMAELHRLGLPAARIRQAAEEAAREWPGMKHPFAHQSLAVNVDRKNHIYVEFGNKGDRKMVQLTGPLRGHFVAGDIARRFMKGVEFSRETGFSERWFPEEGHQAIVLDPEVRFGAPTIAGTRIETAAIAEQRGFHVPVEEIADWYGISVDLVEVACDFERAYPKVA